MKTTFLSVFQVFEVMSEGAGVLTPKYDLDPPHYDGIQSLAIQGNTLFSGSRDTCIKKWDLQSQSLVQVFQTWSKITRIMSNIIAIQYSKWIWWPSLKMNNRFQLPNCDFT